MTALTPTIRMTDGAAIDDVLVIGFSCEKKGIRKEVSPSIVEL